MKRPEELQGRVTFVTGATGFLGGVLALTLAERGARVRALVRTPGKGRFLLERGDVEVVVGDITDAGRMRDLTRGCDCVFHAAAALGGGPERQRRVNVEGTRNVAEAAAGSGVRRLVHISTIMVYGYPHDTDVTEDMGPRPSRDAYSIGKAGAEEEVRRIGRERNLSFAIIRPGAIYGARSRTWTEGMFRRASRRPILWLGDARGNFPAIYVDDVVGLCIRAALHPAAHGQVFNAVMDPPPTVREYLGAYARLTGNRTWLRIPVLPVLLLGHLVSALVPRSHRLRDLPDMVRWLHRCARFRTDRARDLLGWEPEVDLEEGVRRSVPWLRERGLLRD